MHEFQFAAPESLDAVLTLLGERGATARVMTGGTDLIVNMRVGRRQPELVIDGKRIPDLNELTVDGSGLTIGGAVSCRQLWENEQVRTAYPAVIDSAELIGGVAIQGRATLGGNLCNAAPSADGIPTLIVLGATAHIAGPGGTRDMPVEEICVAPGKTSLADNEILISIKVPAPAANSGAKFLRFIPRNEMDIAVVNAAASETLDGDKFAAVRIAVGAVAPTPLFVKEAGDALAGKPVSDESIAEAARIAMEAAKPIADMRGTVKQRKHLTKVLVSRALKGAVERAKGA